MDVPAFSRDVPFGWKNYTFTYEEPEYPEGTAWSILDDEDDCDEDEEEA